MNACGPFKHLLSGYAAGDLTARQASRVEAHLSVCQACSLEIDKFAQIAEVVRRQYGGRYALAGVARRRVLAEAANRPGRFSWLFPATFSVQAWSRLALASAAAAVLALSVPLYHHSGTAPEPRSEEVAQVQVVADHGVVHLAWTDGRKESYTIYKSQDPRGHARTRAFVVRGNAWTDNDPDTSPVVFYRVE